MLPPIVINEHARQAMMLRRVSMDELLQILRRPEVTDTDRHGDTRFFRGRLCVVAKEASNGRRLFIKTVLYRYGEQWTDEDVRRRDLEK